MTHPLAIFNYEGLTVRTIEKNGEPWFVAKDVADALGAHWSGAKTIQHVPEEWRGVVTIPTPGGNQDVVAVSEPGLFFFLNRSDKPAALPMQKWVAGEVLPSIRKTGQYSTKPELQIAHAMLLAGKMIEEQKQIIAEMTPKAQFFDTVTDSTNAVDIGTVAKVLNCGIGRTRLFEFLRDEKILMGNNQPYQRYIDSGYFRIIESSYSKPDGSTHISFKTVVYQKGVDFIRRKLSEQKEAA